MQMSGEHHAPAEVVLAALFLWVRVPQNRSEHRAEQNCLLFLALEVSRNMWAVQPVAWPQSPQHWGCELCGTGSGRGDGTVLSLPTTATSSLANWTAGADTIKSSKSAPNCQYFLQHFFVVKPKRLVQVENIATVNKNIFWNLNKVKKKKSKAILVTDSRGL
jgi:hypothetical protein